VTAAPGNYVTVDSQDHRRTGKWRSRQVLLGGAVMTVTLVPAPSSPSPLRQLVDDYLMSCRARGLAPGTISTSYGYPLRSVFLPWCDAHGIERPEQFDVRAVDAFSVDLLDRPGKSGRRLSKFTVHAYVRGV